MTEIYSGEIDNTLQRLTMTFPAENLDFEAVKNTVRERARKENPNAMLLSWYHRETGKYWPTYDCGAGGKAPWKIFAESRGANLLVNVNDGQWQFYFIRI